MDFILADDPAYVARLIDIKARPELHRHTFAELQTCCTLGGVVHVGLLDAHAKYAPTGNNGGKRCDVIQGACACGAWH